MSKNLFITAIATSICLLIPASCGGRTGSAASDSDSGLNADTVTYPAQMDSTMSKTDTVAEAKSAERTFASAQEARQFMENSGHWESYQKGILPQMADENLKYAQKLLNNQFNYFIVVDKELMKVMLFDKYGVLVKDYGMCCARNFGTKHKRSDCRTPEGFFTVEGVYDSTDWLYTDDNGYTSPTKGVYGKRFIRLRTPVTNTVGIHGTNSPGSIGRRSSHGCIRVHNENIMDLVKYAKKDMPVIVSPSRRDMVVNHNEGYNVPAVTTNGKRLVVDYAKEAAKANKADKASADTTAVAPAEEVKTPVETPAETPEQKPAEPVQETPVPVVE